MKIIIILLISVFVLNCFKYSNAQVFDINKIPLTPGAFITTSNVRYTSSSLSMKHGNTELKLGKDGLKLLYKGTVVWFPFDYSQYTNVDPVLAFGESDGNICLIDNPNDIPARWCTYYYGVGSKYLNILPEGSYGRQWAIVTQDESGKMTWGRFGPAINTRGIMPLIPGNYLDAKSSTNNQLTSQNGRQCINNGKDYFCTGSRASDAASFYAPLKSSNFAAEPEWKVANIVSGKVARVLFGGDTNFCVTDVSGNPRWCNGYVHLKQRYLVIPIASDYDGYASHAAWVTLDDDMKLVSGRAIYLVSDVPSITSPFPTSGLSNDFLQMEYSTSSGAITYKSKLESSQIIKTTTPTDSFGSATFGSGFLDINEGFYFYKKPSFTYASCNFMNQQCYSVIEKFTKYRRIAAQSYWNTNKPAKWFGLSRYIPEVILLDQDGMIISSSTFFNRTKYQY